MAILTFYIQSSAFQFLKQAQSLRKKMSRIEEENESLVMQLKKMAMKKGGGSGVGGAGKYF